MVANNYGEEAAKKILEGTQTNAFDFMDTRTANIGDYTAMTYFKNEISYDEMKQNIYLYANKLKSYGLETGDVISICMPNVPEIVYYKYAAWLLGIKVNVIDPRFNPEGILSFVNKSNAKLLITVLDAFAPKITPIMDRLRVEDIVVVSVTDAMKLNAMKNVLAKSIYGYKEFLLNLNNESFRNSKVIMNRDFLRGSTSTKVNSVYFENMDASIVFTSGTTGISKGAVLTHDAYNIKINQISYGVPNIAAGDTFLAAIPFFSAYGSFAGMHNSLVKGMNMIMIPKFKPDEFSELICQHRINTSIGVPKYWEDFERNFEENKRKYHLEDLSFIKNPVTGGDKIASTVVEKCNKLFAENNSDASLIVGYGSTETAGPVGVTSSEERFYDTENTGILFPGVKYLFLDEDTHEIMPDASCGELAISDPGMMDRYLDDEKSTQEITIEYDGDRYYNMGDIFEINDRGMLYFKGRTKRAMMRPDGHTVHSAPIEDAAMLHKDVDNCCVVGIKKSDGTAGTIPIAFVVLKEGVFPSDDLVRELDELALFHLSERNRALAYTFVGNLPYTLMGKVAYKTLEESNIDDLNLFIVDDTFFPKKDVIRSRMKNK